jgi:Skp family chaperone for outer membrane proteins
MEDWIVKRIAFVTACCLALAAVACFTKQSTAQENPVRPVSASMGPKIALINLAMVLKKFDQANYLGDQLLEEAQQEETRLKTAGAEIQKRETALQANPDVKGREEVAKQLRQEKLQLQEKETDARKKFADRQATMAKEVYQKLNAVIDTIAKTYGYDLVLTYPDATSKEEIESPQQAFRMLSAPAVMVVWKNPNLDITETVVKYLNHNFPAPNGYKSGSKPLAVTPMK